MPEVLQIINGFNDYLNRRERDQMIKMAERWRQQEKILMLYIQRLSDAIDARRLAGQAVGMTAITHLQTYKDLLVQVTNEARRFEQFAANTIAGEQAAYYEVGIAAAQAAITQSVGAGVAFNRINPSAVQNMVGLTADGSPLFDVLKKRALAPDMVAGLTDKLVEGIALGYNPRKTAEMMADGLARGLSKALTIARTEQIRAYREATLEQYRESGMVKQYQRHASHGERTCLECLALDGQIRDVDELIESHPNCRCFITPVIPGVANPTRESGSDWLAKQNEALQREVLGSHYDLYKSGIPIDEMIKVTNDPVWGPTLGVKPLSDFD